MIPLQQQFPVEPRRVKSKFLLSVKLALVGAAMLVSLAPFQLSAQETRKDAVVKVPPALEAAIAESHEALRKILNGDPSGCEVGTRWKLVHRHADPITTSRPAESMLGK